MCSRLILLTVECWDQDLWIAAKLAHQCGSGATVGKFEAQLQSCWLGLYAANADDWWFCLMQYATVVLSHSKREDWKGLIEDTRLYIIENLYFHVKDLSDLSYRCRLYCQRKMGMKSTTNYMPQLSIGYIMRNATEKLKAWWKYCIVDKK